MLRLKDKERVTIISKKMQMFVKKSILLHFSDIVFKKGKIKLNLMAM